MQWFQGIKNYDRALTTDEVVDVVVTKIHKLQYIPQIVDFDINLVTRNAIWNLCSRGRIFCRWHMGKDYWFDSISAKNAYKFY